MACAGRTPGPGKSNRSMPRVSTCGCGCRPVGMRSRSRGAAATLARGSVYATLTAERQGVAPVVRVNEPILNAVLATLKDLSGKVDAEPPRLDGILTLKGIIEVIDEDEKPDERLAAEQAAVSGFQQAIADPASMRRRERAALGQVLSQRVQEIAA